MILFDETAIKIMMVWHFLWSLQKENFFLHLENKMCGSGRLCGATVLHYNAELSHSLSLSSNNSFCKLYIPLDHIAILSI